MESACAASGGEHTPARTSRIVAASRCAALGVAAGGEEDFATGLEAVEEVSFFCFMRGLLHHPQAAARDTRPVPTRRAAAPPAAGRRRPVRLADRPAAAVPHTPLAGARVRSP